MKTFTLLCFLVPLLLVEQLRCAEGERLGLRGRRQRSRATPHQHSCNRAAAAEYFSQHSNLSSGESCEEQKDSSSGQDQNSRSLSPWTYIICTDQARYPPTIKMAKCEREDCVYPGTESRQQFRHLRHLISVPLKHTMDVWYKKRFGQQVILTRSSLTVTIGCTCVKRRTHSS